MSLLATAVPPIIMADMLTGHDEWWFRETATFPKTDTMLLFEVSMWTSCDSSSLTRVRRLGITAPLARVAWKSSGIVSPS